MKRMKYSTEPAALATEVEWRFWSKVDKSDPDGCWEWKGFIHPDGYGMFMIPSALSKSRTRRAHRFAWELAHGPIPEGNYICHHCDNPRCVRPSHLFAGTSQDNALDREAKGRRDVRGAKHPQAKLTEQQVRDIRANAALCRVTFVELAERYGVNRSHIRNIVKRQTWKHI